MSKPLQTTNNAIDVKNLCVAYDEVQVLRNISFSIPPANISAIIGPNGSGKTTLIRAMLGLAPVTKGQVAFFGQPLSHMRKAIGYVPQRFEFDRQFPMTVREFLELARHTHTPKREMKRALKEVGLKPSDAEKQIGTLSGGQLQRILIAQAILNNPSILILDEPSAGIDVVGEAAFFHMIDNLRKKHQTTIILISHDISFVASSVDQVICINKKLMCAGPPNVALNEKTLGALFGSKQHIYQHNHS